MEALDDGPYVMCEECGAMLPAVSYDLYDSYGQPLPVICDECMELAQDED